MIEQDKSTRYQFSLWGMMVFVSVSCVAFALARYYGVLLAWLIMEYVWMIRRFIRDRLAFPLFMLAAIVITAFLLVSLCSSGAVQ
jgi:hypothetical protein